MIADVPAWVLLPLLGCLIRLACVAPTVLATWRGEDSPSLVSWSVWTATTGLGAATGVAAGEPIAAAVPGAAFVQCSAMFAATAAARWRFPDRRPRATRLDWTCLALCACTGTVWAAALLLDRGDPATAVLIATVVLCAAVATDGIASGPTWRLASQGREPWLLWAGAATTPALTLLVLSGGSVAAWVYPGYELALTAGIATLTMWHRRRAVAVATAGTFVGVAGVVLGWQLWPRDVAPVLLWTTVLAAAVAAGLAAVIVSRAWAVARGQHPARPLSWTVLAVATVAVLVVQLRMGLAPLAIQAAVLAFAFVQMAVVSICTAWVRPALVRARPPAPSLGPQPLPPNAYSAYIQHTRGYYAERVS